MINKIKKNNLKKKMHICAFFLIKSYSTTIDTNALTGDI